MKTNLYFYVKILAAVGITLALYLLWEQLFHPSFQPCSINASVNCDAIISGAVAKTLGIPTPVYGLTGYIVILLAAIYRKRKLLLGIATFGLAFCLWIAFREIVQLHVICPVCILCDIDMITTFVLAVIILKKK
jgi:uncharacterized membrane protein